jgi:hypothetical protein
MLFMATCNCGAIVNETEELPLDERLPCAECGSLARVRGCEPGMVIASGQAGIKIKGRHGQPGEVKPFIEVKLADEVYRKTGERTHREKIEDRENDRYQENVVSQATGAVLHECDEPLSDHQGHGSARKTKP